ncbi:hypothetical protein COCVIDRAFT_84293 [Bipolaris victoriae FI3]|uniref:Uncharacterized protein n=1 Tax=Bipolaris victoriae (strain FI3) TaxID=930091 RepID=W7F104_BIPV3|nr:hypothetical protein COCVIDRAFT_84293 [Bipolaris victoriae FI3]
MHTKCKGPTQSRWSALHVDRGGKEGGKATKPTLFPCEIRAILRLKPTRLHPDRFTNKNNQSANRVSYVTRCCY